jgi:AGCS family alanine or glycine:cation symporter
MLSRFNETILGVAVPLLLIGAGLFFLIYLRFFPLLRPLAMARALTERQAGGTSPFRALTLALAGTLGVGNIVGVSAAIAMGGTGAILWMWVSALCAMLLKYAEIVLAMRHRRYDADGTPHGSAMYYIRDCLTGMGLPRLGWAVAAVFALLYLLCALSVGSTIQIHAIASALEGVMGVPSLLTGAVIGMLCAVILRRGSQGIMRLTDTLVPLMTAGFLLLSAAALILRADQIPTALASIVSDALTTSAAAGGIGGFLLSRGVRYGTMRGLISNEGGCGTAPAAHATSASQSPAKQGVWGILEVFVDTVLLCTVTALVIIVSGVEVPTDGDFMMMTIHAYGAILGTPAAVFLTVAVLLSGFATLLCWSHYGMESTAYLSGRPHLRRTFLWIYVASIPIGALFAADFVWDLSDLATGGMTLINVAILLAMRREVREETQLWLETDRRRGLDKRGKV